MKDEEIRAQLLANNPFFSGSAADPWENRAPDVSSLNQTAYTGICSLINARKAQPWEPMAGLVMGEAGGGKTHLLRRLLTYTRENNIAVTFASVRPFLDPEAPMRHLLSEIVVNLTKVERGVGAPGKEKRKQFEYLVSQLMNCYSRESGDSGFGLDKVVSFFRENFPHVESDVLRALFHYRNLDRRSAVLSWLGGETIDEDAARELRVPDRYGWSGAALEAEAAKIVRSLGQLLQFCGMSMVVCFDQLDGMKDKSIIQVFGKAVHFIVNEVPAMLPLSFIRTDTWYGPFENDLDRAVRQRIEGNLFVLDNCTLEQAQELIRMRIEAFFREESDEKYHWLLKRLEGKLRGEYAPRLVIELANRVILRVEETISPVPDPDTFCAVFADEYRQAKDAVAADFDMWPPDTDRLRCALETWLKTRPDFGELEDGDDRYIALTGKCSVSGRFDPCAFIVNTAGHNKTAEAAFRRGVRFLREHGGRCWYVIDERCNFPGPDRWKVVHQIREEFESLGGRVLILDRQRAVEWYGLTSLIFKMKNGDISLPDPANVLRPAGEKDFDAFMEKGFEADLLAASAVAPGVPPPPAEPPIKNEAALEKKTATLLRHSPMRLEKATLLLGELTKQGESLSYELFLEFVNKRRERFALHPSSNGSLVQLLK